MECVYVSHYPWCQCQTHQHTYTTKGNPSTTYVIVHDKKATWVVGAVLQNKSFASIASKDCTKYIVKNHSMHKTYK